MSTKQTLEKGVKYAGRQQERHQSDVVDVRCYVFLVDFEKLQTFFLVFLFLILMFALVSPFSVCKQESID